MRDSEPDLIIDFPWDNQKLNALFERAWPDHVWCDFQPILSRSLVYAGVMVDGNLAGFVNVATDGGVHAFVLDTTVDPDYRRTGLGVKLVKAAAEAAARRGAQWLHVDYEPHLAEFYRVCGFRPTEAGLMRLR